MNNSTTLVTNTFLSYVHFMESLETPQSPLLHAKALNLGLDAKTTQDFFVAGGLKNINQIVNFLYSQGNNIFLYGFAYNNKFYYYRNFILC